MALGNAALAYGVDGSERQATLDPDSDIHQQLVREVTSCIAFRHGSACLATQYTIPSNSVGLALASLATCTRSLPASDAGAGWSPEPTTRKFGPAATTVLQPQIVRSTLGQE